MPLVSFSVACLSCLSFFSPLCRLTAHSLPSSWLRHGWPFLFLLYIPRVIKNEESRKEQEHYERSRSKRGRRRTVRIGRTSPHSLPNPGFTHFFLSICLFLTLTENWHSNCLFREWLDSFCVATCTCVSPPPFSLYSLESCQFRRQHRLAQMFSSFSHLYRKSTRTFSFYTHTLFLAILLSRSLHRHFRSILGRVRLH